MFYEIDSWDKYMLARMKKTIEAQFVRLCCKLECFSRMDKFSTLGLYEQGSRLGLLPYLPSVEMSAKVKHNDLLHQSFSPYKVAL
jgi:hypothetical protein